MVIKSSDANMLSLSKLNPEGGSRYGVVIGIEKYQDRRLNLRYARNDAEAVYNLMIDPECGMFPLDHVVLLVDEAATYMNIRWELDNLRQKARKNDVVWIYYAGYGAPEDDEFYWIPHDGNLDRLRVTGISRKFIADTMDKINAKNVFLFLDSSHEEAAAKQKKQTPQALNSEALFRSYRGRKSVTLAATDGRQSSAEPDEMGHGAFTFYLIQGLRGEADVSQNGVVTIDNLWRYLSSKVSETSPKTGLRRLPILDRQQTLVPPLTVTPRKALPREHIIEYIESLIGPGDNALNTEEAEFCLKILRSGPSCPSEEAVMSEFNSLLEKTTPIRTFKHLVFLARNQSGFSLEGALNGNKFASQPLLEPLEDDLKQRGVPLSRRMLYYQDFAADWPGTTAGQNALKRIEEIQQIVSLSQEDHPSLPAETAENMDYIIKRLPTHGATEEHDLGNGVTLEMIYLKGGVFQMGSPTHEKGRQDDEGPVHEVELDGFWIGRFEVTQRQYEALMGRNPSRSESPENPVDSVTWYDAIQFCRRLSQKTEQNFRLPTEAEWEYACRAGTRSRFFFGDFQYRLRTYAWFNKNAGGKTHPVGTRNHNAWELFDMHGNVWEWCSDHYEPDYYENSPRKNPKGPTGEMILMCGVLRGGCWSYGAVSCRSACRNGGDPNAGNDYCGFRLIRDE